MHVTKASGVAVLAVVVALAGFAQWRAAAVEGRQEERQAEPEKKVEPEKKAQPAAAGRRLATVYLRAEAAGHDLNYIPTPSQLPRVQGELVRIDADWVVVSSKGRESMVARSAVLMVVTEGQ